MKADTERTNC